MSFYTLWRLYLGIDCLFLEADNVGELMAQIEDRFGSQLQQQLCALGIQANRKIQDYSFFLLNGYSVGRQNLRQVKLRAGDVLHILPLAMGG